MGRPLLCVLLVAAATCAREDESTLAIRSVRVHPVPPLGASLPAPRALTATRSGQLRVLDTAGRVLMLDPAGALLGSWSMPEVEAGRPEGLCELADSRIVVADTHYHRLAFFAADGTLLDLVGREGTGTTEFLYPARVLQDPDGFLYVAEYGGNDRIQKLTDRGRFVLEMGRFGTRPGELQRPAGMAWRDGVLYVADAANQRIQRFSATGSFLDILPTPGLRFPYDLCIAPDGTLYVAEFGGGCVTALTLEGELVGRYRGDRSDTGGLRTPWSLCLDQTRHLWIADTGHHRLVELVP